MGIYEKWSAAQGYAASLNLMQNVLDIMVHYTSCLVWFSGVASYVIPHSGNQAQGLQSVRSSLNVGF